MRKLFFLFFFPFLFAACSHQPLTPKIGFQVPDPITEVSSSPAPSNVNINQQLNNQESMVKAPTPDTKPAQSAIIKTNFGDITIKLFPQQAPIAVASFAALAEGTISWIDPSTGQEVKDTPLYNNTIFHRVITGFMLQGGDPTGTGRGGPGYRFEDEIDATLNFDKPYIFAMANSGPATNGSQFFITTAPTPWLTGKHTIFGEVTAGQDVVDTIESVETGPNDKPVKDVIIQSITISR